jgi:GAF domain-containing protein
LEAKHVAERDVEQLLKRILEQAKQVVPFHHGGVVLVDAERGLLVPRAVLGFRPDSAPPTLGLGEGVVGWVAESGQTALLADLEHDERYVPADPEIRSALAAPMRIEDRVIGVLIVESRKRNAYTKKHAATLSVLADLAATTLQTTQLYTDLQENYETLTEIYLELAVRNELSRLSTATQELDQILPALVDGLMQLVTVDAAALALWKRDEQTVRRVVAVNLDPPPDPAAIVMDDDMARLLIEKREPIAVTAAEALPFVTAGGVPIEGYAHILGIPLTAHEHILGGAFLFRTAGAPFNQEDATRAIMLAHQIALAVENNLLLEDMQVRLSETEMLQRVASIASSALGIDTLLRDVLAETANYLDVEVSAAWLPDPTVNDLLLHKPSLIGLPVEGAVTAWPLDGEDPLGIVYRTMVSYVDDAPVAEVYPWAGDSVALTNAAIVPVITHGQLSGLLLFANKRDGPFARDHIKVLEAISNQVGITMDNARLYTNEQKRAELMQMINVIGGELTTLLDLEEIFRRVVARIREMLNYEVVYLFRREGPELSVSAHAGPEGRPLMPVGYRFPVTQGIAGRAIRTGRSYVSRDVLLDPDYFEPEAMAGLRAVLSVPIKSGERIIGALDVISEDVAAFDETDRKAVETLAAQIAIAIENARLYEEAQRRLLEQGIVYQIGQDLIAILDVHDLARTVVRHMAPAMATTGCLIQLYNAEDDKMTVIARHSIEEASSPHAIVGIPETWRLGSLPAVAEAARGGGPLVIVADNPETGAAERTFLERHQQKMSLIIPMYAGERLLGLVQWLEDRTFRAFHESEIRLARTLANQAATALEKARLHEATERQLLRESLLREVAEMASASLERDVLMQQFAAEASRALGVVESAAFSLEGNVLRVASRYRSLDWEGAKEGRDSYALDDFPAIRKALHKGTLLSLSPEGGEDRRPEIEDLKATGFASALFAPLVSHERPLGALVVFDERPERRFDSDDQTMLAALANQFAIALDNVRLYEAEQRRRRLLEAIQAASEALTGELQIQALLDLVVNKVAEVFTVPAAGVMLLDEVSRSLALRAGYGLSHRFLRERFIPQQVLADIARGEKKNRPILLSDLSRVAGRQEDLMAGEGIREMVLVPLTRGDTIFGALNLYVKEENVPFGEDELEILQLLARQIAIALDNARLFDILEQRALELEQASRLKSEFLANISHELRTPMNSIIGFSETLLSGLYGPMTEKQTNRLDTVRRNAYRLLALIDNLLDISRIEAGQMTLEDERINISEELHHVLDIAEPQILAKKLALYREIPDDLPPVRGDSERLRQVFTNLLVNAIKFTEKGRITVSAEYIGNGAGEVILRFEDTGIGIAEGNLDIVFDEFRQVDGSSTRRYEGTGLGLAITKKLLNMMDGRIWVESELGKGSTFYVALPATREPPDNEGAEETP